MLHLIPISVLGFATFLLAYGIFYTARNIVYVVVDCIKNPEPKLPDAVVRYLEEKAAAAHDE